MPAGSGPVLIAYDGSGNAKHTIAVAGEVLAAHPAFVVTVGNRCSRSPTATRCPATWG